MDTQIAITRRVNKLYRADPNSRHFLRCCAGNIKAIMISAHFYINRSIFQLGRLSVHMEIQPAFIAGFVPHEQHIPGLIPRKIELRLGGCGPVIKFPGKQLAVQIR